MSIAERLHQLIRVIGIAQSDLAREIGVSPGALSEACSGKRLAPWTVVVGIANRYPEVSADWLLTGRGSMHHQRGPPGADAGGLAIGEPPPPGYGDARLREVQERLVGWWSAASPDDRAWLAVDLRRRYPDVWGPHGAAPGGDVGQ